MKSLKRKTRSDKFPLTLHPSGQYCKRIRGKLYYFGSDKKAALEKYHAQAVALHGGQYSMPNPNNGEMLLKKLCEIYLKYQYSLVQVQEITLRHHHDQIVSLDKFMNFIGANRKIENITTLELQNYKKMLQKSSATAHRLNLHISIMKALFHWAKKNEILEQIPNIDAISRKRIVNKERYVFSSEDIKKLLCKADMKMKAMIWLGLNCGFGCTDCAELQWKNIDFEKGRIFYPRRKTGIVRNLPLWPESVVALQKLSRKNRLVFQTSRNQSYITEVLQN